VEAEAAPVDVPAAGASDVNVTVEDDGDTNDFDKMKLHQFDKNAYTFSAAAGRALQQQQASNIRNLE